MLWSMNENFKSEEDVGESWVLTLQPEGNLQLFYS